MIDYLVDNTCDLQIANGDFLKGDSTLQNQQAILMGGPNDYKQFPDACVGIMNFLKDSDESGLLRATRLKFTKDGMTVKSLSMANGIIQTVAPYANS